MTHRQVVVQKLRPCFEREGNGHQSVRTPQVKTSQLTVAHAYLPGGCRTFADSVIQANTATQVEQVQDRLFAHTFYIIHADFTLSRIPQQKFRFVRMLPNSHGLYKSVKGHLLRFQWYHAFVKSTLEQLGGTVPTFSSAALPMKTEEGFGKAGNSIPLIFLILYCWNGKRASPIFHLFMCRTQLHPGFPRSPDTTLLNARRATRWSDDWILCSPQHADDRFILCVEP